MFPHTVSKPLNVASGYVIGSFPCLRKHYLKSASSELISGSLKMESTTELSSFIIY